MSTTLITPEEYQERVSRLQQRVAEAGLDLFIVSAEESIQYLTGVSYTPLERPFFILIRPQGQPELLVPMLERDHLAEAASVRKVTTYWDYPSLPGEGWADRLLEVVGSSGAIGIEPTLPAEVSMVLADRQPAVLPLVEELRLVKSPAEIELLRHAARYADMGVERALHAAYQGASLLELFGQGRSVQTRMIQEVGYDALLSSVLVGAWPAPGSAKPHDVPPVGARLEEGPHIALAMIRVHGYCAECERTSFTVRPGSEARSAFAAMMEARRRAFELARPGVPCSELDAAANGFLREEGYGANLMHRTGHGFGLSTHEGPWVAEGSEDVLAPGMLISVEPGIYLPGVGGVRHSDTVLITEGGYECLTQFPTDLESLTVGGAKLRQRLMGALTRRVAGV
ncbi:MAG: Xaa-Pro peptidase family protein [Anaerolineae bacterium]|jgi:Xaa-Pro dipeptidase